MIRLYDYLGADRLPRKFKKNYLGRKLSKSKLRKLINSVQIVENKYPESETILPYEFCPRCGCTATCSTGNMAPYPERWVNIFCARCGHLVMTSDNSPYYHCLTMKDENYNID